MAKVLLVTHWDWVLYNFRLPLARALRDKGYEVVFVCPFGEYTGRLQSAGFGCIHWSVVRRSLNPARELFAIVHLTHIYRAEKPDLVCHFTVKPNFHGSVAAAFMRDLKVINTFTGLGFLFSNHSIAKSLRLIVVPVFRLLVQKPRNWTVAQNFQDAETLLKLKLASPTRTSVIVSSGVNVQLFSPNGDLQSERDSRPPIVLIASRLLWDKGVMEFVEAARLLKERGISAEFWLAGKPDDGNPMSVPEEWVKSCHERGNIRWLGHCDNMPELLRHVDIAVLPSYYHEGVPRFLLEAAASGLPLVATDIEGCRLIVRNGVNGFIVPPKDPKLFADALERLIKNPDLRRRMGEASRKIAEEEFNERRILSQWLELYEWILNS